MWLRNFLVPVLFCFGCSLGAAQSNPWFERAEQSLHEGAYKRALREANKAGKKAFTQGHIYCGNYAMEIDFQVRRLEALAYTGMGDWDRADATLGEINNFGLDWQGESDLFAFDSLRLRTYQGLYGSDFVQREFEENWPQNLHFVTTEAETARVEIGDTGMYFLVKWETVALLEIPNGKHLALTEWKTYFADQGLLDIALQP